MPQNAAFTGNLTVFAEKSVIAFEEVILQLMSTKYMLILLYGLVVVPVGQSLLRSRDFMINKVHLCQDLFHF